MLTKYDLATRLEPQYRVRDEFGRLFNRGKKQLWLWRVTFSFFQHHPSACLLLPSCSSWDDISSAATICHHLLWQMKRQWKTKNKMTTWMVEILIKHLTFLLCQFSNILVLGTKLQTQFLWTLFLLNKIIPITMMNWSLIWTTITIKLFYVWPFWKGVDLWYRDRSE